LTKLASAGLNTTDNTSFIGLVLTTLEGMGYRVFPQKVEASASVVDMFQQTIASLTVAPSKTPLLEIHGTPILASLAKLGWTILAPRIYGESSPTSEISLTQVRQFEHSIAQHCTIPTTEPDDVSGYAILHALADSGWVIIPPQ
jgi:hypothetical protein